MPIKRLQHGVALLEVMISVLILAVGLLGLAQLQILTLKYNESAYLRSQASTLAANILDRMRANQLATQAGNYNFALSDTPPVSPSLLADIDIVGWLNNISLFMPAGSSGVVSCADSINTDTIACSEGSLHTVTISWVEVQDDGSRGTNSFAYSGVL